MDESTKSSYKMTLGRYLRKKLGIHIKFTKNSLVGGKGSQKGFTPPMYYLNNHGFELLNSKNPN